MAVVHPAFVVAAFDRFWAAYPPRPVNPRTRALVRFAHLVKEGEDPEVLIGAAGRFAVAVKAAGIKPLFVPHACTWLNQRDFDDYPAPDGPALAESAQPGPEHPAHPLTWLRDHMTPQAWTSWIAQLAVDETTTPPTIAAPSDFVRERVDQDYGHLIRRRLGVVTWRIERREP